MRTGYWGALLVAGVISAGTASAYTKSAEEHQKAVAELKSRLQREPNDVKVLTELGERLTLWMRDHEGDVSDVPMATFYLDRAIKTEPKNPLPVAWMGVLTMVRAKNASLFDKKDLAKEGLKHLDRAIEIDGQNPKVRMMRGSVGINLPNSFDRYEQARDDLLQALKTVGTDAKLAASHNISLCVLNLNLGKAHRKLNCIEEARRYWEVACKLEPGREEAGEAQKLLETTLASSSGGWKSYVYGNWR